MASMKNVAKAVGGLAVGGVAAIAADAAVQSTDYAKSDPKSAMIGKAVVGVLALAAGVALLRKAPLAGAALAGGGVALGAKGYMDYDTYKQATAPAVVTVSPGAGGTPLTITAPSGGLPAVGGTPVLMAGPGGVTTGISPTPIASLQSAGAMRLQAGGAMRLQSGAAMRTGVQAGAAARLGM